MDYSEYHMTRQEENDLEERIAPCPVKDTRDAMFAAYKAAGYEWSPVKDAFTYPDGHWISRHDAMAAWLSD